MTRALFLTAAAPWCGRAVMSLAGEGLDHGALKDNACRQVQFFGSGFQSFNENSNYLPIRGADRETDTQGRIASSVELICSQVSDGYERYRSAKFKALKEAHGVSRAKRLVDLDSLVGTSFVNHVPRDQAALCPHRPRDTQRTYYCDPLHTFLQRPAADHEIRLGAR